MSFAGVIFDLDGTMLDNMSFHAQAFGVFAERHGLPPFDLAVRARLDGKRNRDIFPILFERTLSEVEIASFSEEKERLYRELSRGRLQPLRGLERFLELLEERGIPVAIATSAPAPNVVHTLSGLGLAERVRLVARSDQVARGKPFPDVFLAAARLLEVDPARCLAFEDAPLGVVAARAAGMTCVAITTSFSREAMLAAGAEPHAAVADFAEYLETHAEWAGTER